MKSSQNNSNNKTKYFKLTLNPEYNDTIPRKLIQFISQDLFHFEEDSYINKKGELRTKNIKIPNQLKFIESFCYSINISMETFLKWTNEYPELKLSYNRAREIQLEHIVNNTLLNLYPSQFSNFVLKNISEWRDKKDIELSGNVDSKIFFEEMKLNSQQAIENERIVFNEN